MVREHTLPNGLTKPREEEVKERTFLGGGSLSSRMRSFFYLGVIWIAVLVAFVVYADFKSLETSSRLAGAYQLVAFAEDIESSYWQIRGEEKGFLQSDDVDHARRFESAVAATAKNLDAVYGRADSAVLRDHITTVNEGLAQYAKEFRGVVRAAKSVLETATQAGFVMPKAGSDGKARLSAEDRARLQKLSATAKAMLEQEQRTARLDEIAAYLVPSIEGMAATARAEVAAATRATNEYHEGARLILPVIGGTIVLVVVVTGIAIMRSMATPVRAIAEAAQRLSEGDEDVAIPAQYNKDETGDLARSLNAFRSNLGEVHRIRAELKEARAEAERLAAAAVLAADARTVDDVPEADAAPAPPVVAAAPGELASERISEISQRVAVSSQTVTQAAYEAERTGTVIRGLSDASKMIDDVEGLILDIVDGLPAEDDPISLQFGDVRDTASQATRAVKDISDTLDGIKALAMDIADASSTQALETTAQLLEQSESLRGILDDLVSDIRETGGTDGE